MNTNIFSQVIWQQIIWEAEEKGNTDILVGIVDKDEVIKATRTYLESEADVVIEVTNDLVNSIATDVYDMLTAKDEPTVADYDLNSSLAY